jgi:hypothetical protein
VTHGYTTQLGDFTNTEKQKHNKEKKRWFQKLFLENQCNRLQKQVDVQQHFCFVLFFCFGSSLKTGYYFSTVNSMLMLYNNTNSMTQHNKEKKKMVSKSIFRKPMQPVAQQVDVQQHFCYVLFFILFENGLLFFYGGLYVNVIQQYQLHDTTQQREKKRWFPKVFLKTNLTGCTTS